jgi:amino acid adenylation domain-containing protein
VDIAAAITGDQLQLSVLYSENRFDEATMEQLTGKIRESLQQIIHHCLTTTDKSFTPADFPLANIDQQQLDQLLDTSGPVDDLYAVTSLQHGMLFHSLFTAEQDVYFARFRWRLSGPLDQNAFADAWQQVINRHTCLRTSFHWEGLARPVQIVHQNIDANLHTENWEGLSEQQQDQKLSTYLAADQADNFDFTAAPLIRLSLIELGPEDHQFIWSFHHAIIDGWSVPLILKEVFAIYEASRQGITPQLVDSRHFSAYLEWLSQQDMQAAETFWRANMAGFTAPTPLPAIARLPGSDAGQPEFEELNFRIDAQTVSRLRELSAQSRLTLNTVVQGIWALLLSRYSGESDIVYGATTSGRPATMPGVESMIGLFLNTLPLRTTVDPDDMLLTWLEKLQTAQLDVRQYEFASLVEVQGWSDVPRGSPMFESLLAFENYPEMETMWTDTDSISIREVDGFDRTNFPLTVNVAVFDIMHLRLVYDAGLFNEADMQRLGGHFEALLKDIATDARRPLGELSLLTEQERQSLNNWNDTDRNYPQDATLVSLFETQVARSPDAIAVSYASEALSYAELNRRANRLAHYLQGRGVVADMPVGVCIERSTELVVALLGILKAGGAYVPLDPEYPALRLAHMLEDAAISTLLTHSSLAGQLPENSADAIMIDHDWVSIERNSDDNPALAAGPDNLAYLIFTSGSTGRPKGVMNEHHGICNRLLWMQDEYQLDSTDRVVQKTPFSFDVSVWEFFWPLTTGAQLVMARPGGHRDSTYLARLINEQAITTMHFVPSMLQVFLQDPNAASVNSLKRVICSGEALPFELQARFFETIDAELHNLYGPTEAAVDVSYWACEKNGPDTIVPIGRPVANTQLHVVDQTGRAVPVGVPGELWIGGTQVARGYVNRPELSAQSFIPDPFSDRPGAMIYRTGDLVRYRADGNIEFLGRIDNQVKLRGFRIELGEIEASLDMYDTVEQSVVMLREDTPGLKQLVAYVVARNQQNFDAEGARAHLSSELPDYMIPAAFVMLETMPLTPNGKVNRKALPAPDAADPTTEYVAPANDTEIQLAELWSELLGVDRVGIHDDFFALGGHSLIAMQMVSRIMTAINVELPLDSLFNAPTIEDLAKIVNESRNGDTKISKITPISRSSRRTRRKR